MYRWQMRSYMAMLAAIIPPPWMKTASGCSAPGRPAPSARYNRTGTGVPSAAVAARSAVRTPGCDGSTAVSTPSRPPKLSRRACQSPTGAGAGAPSGGVSAAMAAAASGSRWSVMRVPADRLVRGRSTSRPGRPSPGRRSGRDLAAVGDEGVAVDRAGGVAGQEDDDLGDLGRVDQPVLR